MRKTAPERLRSRLWPRSHGCLTECTTKHPAVFHRTTFVWHCESLFHPESEVFIQRAKCMLVGDLAVDFSCPCVSWRGSKSAWASLDHNVLATTSPTCSVSHGEPCLARKPPSSHLVDPMSALFRLALMVKSAMRQAAFSR